MSGMFISDRDTDAVTEFLSKMANLGYDAPKSTVGWDPDGNLVLRLTARSVCGARPPRPVARQTAVRVMCTLTQGHEGAHCDLEADLEWEAA